MTISRRKALIGMTSIGAAKKGGRAGRVGITPLGRGISIHGVLNWPKMGSGNTYVWPPFTDADHALKTSELLQLHYCGFRFVRLTVDIGILLDSDPNRKEILEDVIMSRALQVVDAGLICLVDLHPVRQNPDYDPRKYISGQGSRLYRDLVVQIASRLGSSGNPNIAFELFNEPPTSNFMEEFVWRDVQLANYKAVRSVAPYLSLVLTGGWGRIDNLLNLNVEDYRGDKNIYFTFHYYDPFCFTHQGVTGNYNGSVTSFFHNIPYPASASDSEAILHNAVQSLPSKQLFGPMSRDAMIEKIKNSVRDIVIKGNRNAVVECFERISNWARAHDIENSRILLGEFGVYRPGINENYRVSWIKDVREAAEYFRFSWSLWSYDGARYTGLKLEDTDSRLDLDVLKALGMSGSSVR